MPATTVLRWFHSESDPPIVQRLIVEPEEELALRNQQRLEQAKRILGGRYVLHSSNQVIRQNVSQPREPALATIRSETASCANRLAGEKPMSDPVDALVIDLLEWIGPQSKSYTDVMDAWRTSCPRLPVWEEANARGYITQDRSPNGGAMVSVSALGKTLLIERQAATERRR
jgi:hypothetical protein